ncbi:alkyl sulfatase dimerization domain-containing protein [Bosea sp. (in: a-proteobacteria)]|uniref:alkyl sulfatase dimerization domain-containing protein n=1 Tax=Bosea sp. (in: a-proteobacteria) TaxID=1871050 RepID=UPI003B3AFF6A
MNHPEEFAGREQLRASSSEFRREIVEVAGGVFAAIGYSASNVVLIQTASSSIIIDTSANPVDAQDIVEAFGERFRRPVAAIIYTHNHPDHTGGATVFAGGDNPAIISHRILVESGPEFARGPRDGGDAFGTKLPEALFINAGTQREYGRVTPHTRVGFLQPTRLIDAEEEELVIAGLRLHLVHAPGEAPENIAVWLPNQRVLVPGDIVLKTFPNLSPIRGLKLRPPQVWIASLNRLMRLDAEAMVQGHMRPVIGRTEVARALRDYRDGIEIVLDQTLDGIRRGRTPDELVETVRLPKQLADSPYLQEFYGNVAWAVRGIYADYAGWFDGNATNLHPLTPRARGERMIALMGGVEALVRRASDALTCGDFQWAAELADHVIAATGSREATEIKADALSQLAERQINATARNYYLTTAQYLRGQLS